MLLVTHKWVKGCSFTLFSPVHSLLSWPAAGRGRGRHLVVSGRSLFSWRPPRRFLVCGPVSGRKALKLRLLRTLLPLESVESASREQRVRVKSQRTIKSKSLKTFTLKELLKKPWGIIRRLPIHYSKNTLCLFKIHFGQLVKKNCPVNSKPKASWIVIVNFCNSEKMIRTAGWIQNT